MHSHSRVYIIVTHFKDEMIISPTLLSIPITTTMVLLVLMVMMVRYFTITTSPPPSQPINSITNPSIINSLPS